MGTRSLTFVMDEDFQPCVCIYGQYDGYPEQPGRGWDLYNFLAGRNKVNGYDPRAYTWKNTSNGMQDLAAQLVMYLKSLKNNSLGNIYLYAPPRLREENETLEEYEKYMCMFAQDCWGEYAYFITSGGNGKINIKIYALRSPSNSVIIYNGSPDGLMEKFGYEDLGEMLNPTLEMA